MESLRSIGGNTDDPVVVDLNLAGFNRDNVIISAVRKMNLIEKFTKLIGVFDFHMFSL